MAQRTPIARIVLPVLLCAAGAGVGGCVPQAWHAMPRDLPWSGPREQLREESRTVAYFLIPAGYVETRWRGPAGQIYRPEDVASQAFAYLKKTGAAAGWPEVPSRYKEGGTDRLAPFYFTIVSVRPTVVIMRPADSADPRQVQRNEAGGNVAGAPALWVPGLANGFEYETRFPYHPDLLWFSPDLNQPPTPVGDAGKSGADLPLPEGTIHLQHAGGQWQATRF